MTESSVFCCLDWIFFFVTFCFIVVIYLFIFFHIIFWTNVSHSNQSDEVNEWRRGDPRPPKPERAPRPEGEEAKGDAAPRQPFKKHYKDEQQSTAPNTTQDLKERPKLNVAPRSASIAQSGS